MNMKKIFAALLVGAGIFMMAAPFVLKYNGEHEAEVRMEAFEEQITEYEEEGVNEIMDAPDSSSAEQEADLWSKKVIGIIEIKSIGIRYPVYEGAGKAALNAGIGHEPDTAEIGEKGNCVLCGHNGSRYGTFFTTLSKVRLGDEVEVTDRTGEVHKYEIAETKVIEPTDTSIKAQGDEEILTLFTCAEKGAKRFVCICDSK